MIIQNGTIEWVTVTGGGGIDPETGHVIPLIAELSAPVPCQMIPAKEDRLAVSGKTGEHFTELKFTILVEDGRPVAPGNRLLLRTLAGGIIGEFLVTGMEPLDAVGQSSISVTLVPPDDVILATQDDTPVVTEDEDYYINMRYPLYNGE